MSNKPNGHSSLPDDAPTPRFCHLRKNFPEQEYGFDLHAEKLRGQFIGNVEECSPASSAGLRRGDRIIAVNGASVVNESHKEVVRRIREDPLQCRFVVIDEDGYHWYANRKMSFPIVEAPVSDHSQSPLASEVAVDQTDKVLDAGAGAADATAPISVPVTADMTLKYDSETGVVDDYVAEARAPSEPEKRSLNESGSGEVVPSSPKSLTFRGNTDENPIEEQKPRLCKLVKRNDEAEYGFNLHAEKGKGHFIGKVDPNSIADEAGLIHGYRIVGVNGILIYPRTPHKEVVALIKQDSLKTELLIASSELDVFYSERKLSFSFNDAEIFEPQTKETPPSKISSPNDSQTLMYESNGLIAGDDNLDRQGTLDGDKELNDHCIKENGVSEAHTDTTEPVYNGHDKNGDVNPKPKTVDAQFLRMSALEMREYLSRHKKADPRREQIPLREKYDIVQNL